jgi:hypothetical protein
MGGGCDPSHTNMSPHANHSQGQRVNYVIEYDDSALCNVNHSSGVVNGHYSNVPNATANPS